MKKKILVVLTVLSMSSAFSQTDKGQKFIGGQMNLQGSTSAIVDVNMLNNSQNFNVNVVPSLGFFVKDNFAVGATLNYGYSRSTLRRETPVVGLPFSYISNNQNTSNGFGIGGFARYYFDLSDKFSFFLNGGLNYTYSIQENITTENNPSDGNPGTPISRTNLLNTANIGVSPGFVFFVTPKFGIQTSIGSVYYQFTNSHSKQAPTYTSNMANYGFNFNLTSFYFGINFHF